MKTHALYQTLGTLMPVPLLLLASLILPSPLLSQPSVVEVKMPRFQLPDTPLDEQVRVAVVFPTDPQGSNPTFRSYYHGKNHYVDVTLEVDIMPALEKVVSQVIHTLFPRTTIYKRRPPEHLYDLLLIVSPRSTALTAPTSSEIPSNVLMYLDVDLHIDVLGTDEEEVDKLTLTVRQRPTHSVAWSNRTRSKTLAREILLDLAPRLQRELATAKGIDGYLRSAEVNRAKECQLVVEASFDDRESVIPNGDLDAAEQAKLLIDVLNKGPGPAFGVSVLLQGDLPGVTFRPSYPVGNLKVGETRRLEVPLAAAISLNTQKTYLEITAKEERQFDSQTVRIPIEQRELVPPTLQILRLECVDPGMCEQDGDQMVVATGGVVTANLWIQNTGPGDAKDLALSASSLPESVTLLAEPDKLDVLTPGSAKPIRFRLKTNRLIPQPSLDIRLTVQDARAERFEATYEATWRVKQREPNLRADLKLFDDGEFGSSGNADGFLNNGEKGIVEVSLRNDGDLDAEDVQIGFSCCSDQEILDTQQFHLEKISSRSRARPLYFELEIPWAMADPGAERLYLKQLVSQAGFPAKETTPALPYKSLQPILKLKAPPEIEIPQGAKTDLLLGIRNDGNLPAKEVEVEVSLGGEGVDLVSPDGVRMQTAVWNVGGLDSQTTGQTWHFGLGARGGAKAGAATAQIRVSQAHFPAAEYTLPIKVLQREYEQKVKAGTQVASGQVMIRSKPVVVFDTPREGDLVSQAEVAVRFSVYSDGTARLMRISQNGRDLDLNTVESQGRRGTRAMYKVLAYLEPGSNRFSATAVDELGVVGESSVTATLTEATANAAEGPSQSIVLDVDRSLLEELQNETEFQINGRDVLMNSLGGGTAEFTSLGVTQVVRNGLNSASMTIKGVSRKVLLWRYKNSLQMFPNLYESSYAIVAAIDDYDRANDAKGRGPTGFQPLNGMVEAARALKRRLIEVGFPEANIFTLYNSEATSTAIDRLLREFWKGGRYDAADRLFFYFGGHGGTQGNEGYLVTYDMDPKRPAASSFLMSDIVHRHFPLTSVHHFFVALDTCASGLAVPGAEALGEEDVESLRELQRLSVLRGDMAPRARNLLVAATGKEEAWSTRGGIFTRALIKALGGSGDLNGDSIVQALELAVFVRNEVIAETADTQVPHFYPYDQLGNGRVVFVLRSGARLASGALR